MAPILYDASAVSRILGLPVESSDPVPEAADGELVVYYGGWDLKALRESSAGRKCMWQSQDWYEKYGWKAEPCYYRLLLPVPGSNYMSCPEQLAHLQTIYKAWQPAPVFVAATALHVHLTETGEDLLQGDWCSCAEALPDERRVVLTVRRGRLFVDDRWDDFRYDYLWLAGCRKS